MNSERIAQIVEPLELMLGAYNFASSPKIVHDGCRGTARRAHYGIKYAVIVGTDGQGKETSNLACQLTFSHNGNDEVLYHSRCVSGPDDLVDVIARIARRELLPRLQREFGL
jgi:hypothetical protein